MDGNHKTHFEHIEYDAQLPIHIREYLAKRKVELMLAQLKKHDLQEKDLSILDVGCGTGDHMRLFSQIGFQATVGLDFSGRQVRQARAKNPQRKDAVIVGDVLSPPFSNNSFDIVYAINLVHHLPSRQEQKRTTENLIALAKTGGMIFIHEMNIKNPAISFYLKHIFPRLKKIDTGDEIFLKPEFFRQFRQARAIDVQYYTFTPDFTPRSLLSTAMRMERILENSPLKSWSAHYLVALKKTG